MKLEEAKNLIYEAEGLLELARLRPEKTEELLPLIKMRIEESLRALDGADARDEHDGSYELDENDEDDENDESDGNHESREEHEVKASARTQPAFCLNDRFRFRRAIFGGSDEDFKAAMDAVAAMNDYGEAEDLFYGDLQLDPEDADVIDFMAIIKNCFEA